MKRIFERYIGVLCIWLCALPCTLWAQEIPDAVAKAKSSIVGVGTQMPTRRPPAQLRGTGFVIGDGRHVITNFHVLPSAVDSANREVLVVFTGSGETQDLRTVRIVATDAEHDLALLRMDGSALPALPLDADVSVREGETLLFTGFPIGAVLGLYPATSQAMVSAITPVVIPAPSSSALNVASIKRLKSPYLVYQLDAIAYPGNSGSPLYRASDLKVVGVINSVLVKETKESVLNAPSAITYAIPVRYAQALWQNAQAKPAVEGSAP